MKLCSRRDPELWVDAIEVRPDGAMRDIEPLADIPVGSAVRSHLGDLKLLRRELIPRRNGPPPARLAQARSSSLARSPHETVQIASKTSMAARSSGRDSAWCRWRRNHSAIREQQPRTAERPG